VELRDYWRVLRRHWILILLITVAGGAAAFGLTALATKTYSAQATVFVSTAPSTSGQGGQSLADSSKFGLDRIKSYVDLANSELVLEPVISDLHLNTTVPALARTVTATNPVDTVLLYIAAADTDPAQAARTANAVANQVGKTIESLETPRAGGTSPVKVTVTRQATIPNVPTSPRPKLNLALGLFLGLAAGIGTAMLRELIDTTIGGAGDVAKITGGAPLASVPSSADFGKNPLVALAGRSVSAESYRTFRTRLGFVDVDHPPRCIVITSAVRGEGKSVSACNLAITLALAGAKVCLVEADLRRPKLHSYMGVDGSVGLSDVLAEQHNLDELLIPWHDGLLTVLTAGTTPPDPSELLGSQHMRDLLHRLRNKFEYVVIDSPPLLPVTDAAVLAQQVDGAVLIVRQGHTRHDQLAQAAEALRQANARLLGTALTFAQHSRGGEYTYGFGARLDAASPPRPAPSVRGTESPDIVPAGSGDKDNHSTTARRALNGSATAPAGRHAESKSDGDQEVQSSPKLVKGEEYWTEAERRSAAHISVARARIPGQRRWR
jgi:capsular exopolysaccharide synthesis family protein